MNGEFNSNSLMRKLDQAVKNLEVFIAQNTKGEMLNLHGLEADDGKLFAKHQEGLNFFSIIRNTSSTNKLIEIQNQLMQSVDFLKQHHKLIKKLKEGSPEQREWAKWALQVIDNFNAIIEKIKIAPNSLKNRVTKFVMEKSGFSVNPNLVHHKIIIPTDPSFYFNASSEDVVETTSQKVSTILNDHKLKESPLTSQETDIFRMKAISLSKATNLPGTLKDTLQSLLWDVPIQSVGLQEGSEETVISLVQTLSAFPGETIKVYGAFKRYKSSVVPSVPISGEFKISSTSKQTGFPDPLQYTGFALSNTLIPEYPNRLDLIPGVAEILEKKQKMAHELLPEGKFNPKAKHLLKQKKELINSHTKVFSPMHQELVESLIASADLSDEDEKNLLNSTSDFFNHASLSRRFCETIGTAYRLINELFIEHPFNKLHEEWLEELNELIIDSPPKEKYKACIHILESAIAHSKEVLSSKIGELPEGLERSLLTFASGLGEAIGNGCKPIVLQKLSEKIGYPPPMLNNYERKLQIVAYRQLLIFQLELDTLDTVSEDYLKNLIAFETALFQGNEEEDSFQDHALSLINELEVYYNSRFYYKS